MSTTTSRTRRRRPRNRLPAVQLWLTVLCLALSRRVSAVRATPERGDAPTVSQVLWAVGALAAATLAVGVLSGYIGDQLAVFGGP